MKSMFCRTLAISCFLFSISASILKAQETQTIQLPSPQKEIGKPLMQTLNMRQSTRSFKETSLPKQELSNLLWAAFGVNRNESGKRTAPSARNWQEIDIYLTTANGVFIYDAKTHSLKQISSEDLRVFAGKQDYVKDAPLNLIYVADLTKTGDASQEDKLLYSGADTGFIAENVYLYCASQDLGVVVRGMIDREILSQKLNLKPGQKIMLAQTIGYKK